MTTKQSKEATAILLGQKVGYGSVIKMEAFEELLGIKRDDAAFGFLVSAVRHHLYSHGLYLSGEGVSETGCYEILAAQDNQWIGRLAVARAERDLEGKQTLLLNTKMDSMSDLQKRRHEVSLRELSLKIRAMRRAHEFDERFKRKGRKLLADATTVEGEISS